jgi:hypothetical protein
MKRTAQLAARSCVGLFALLSVSVGAIVAGARAQDAPLPAAAPDGAESAPELRADGALAQPEAYTQPAVPSAASSQAVLSHKQVAQVRWQLQQLEAQRARSNRLWPSLVVSAGLGAAVVSAAVGALRTFECRAGCSSPTWVSFFVVAGAAVGALGGIWLVRTDADLSELSLRKQHLEYELERWQHAQFARQRMSAQNVPQLSLSFAL